MKESVDIVMLFMRNEKRRIQWDRIIRKKKESEELTGS